MSKKRCNTKTKIKKLKKQNKFKNQDKNNIICYWEKCIKNWSEIIEVQNLGNLYFCEEHKIKFDEEAPILQNYFIDEEIEICERKKCNNKSVNHIQLKLSEAIIRDYFLCQEHTKEYKNKILPELLEKLNKIEKYQEINNNLELIINGEVKKINKIKEGVI